MPDVNITPIHGTNSTGSTRDHLEVVGNESEVVVSNANAGRAVDGDDISLAARLKPFLGTWQKVSGAGYYDKIRVEMRGDEVVVRYGDNFQYYTASFDDINAGAQESKPWVGNGLAPGGRVVTTTTTNLTGNKLEQYSERNETPAKWGGWIPSQLREWDSLELKDGKLVRETESKLYSRRFVWVGPFSRETDRNHTNIMNPEKERQAWIYEKVGD